MNTFPIHDHADARMEKFNGPIVDRQYLRKGTYVAVMTAVGSAFLVLAVKALYLMV